jgi:hypothetical protein
LQEALLSALRASSSGNPAKTLSDVTTTGAGAPVTAYQRFSLQRSSLATTTVTTGDEAAPVRVVANCGPLDYAFGPWYRDSDAATGEDGAPLLHCTLKHEVMMAGMLEDHALGMDLCVVGEKVSQY